MFIWYDKYMSGSRAWPKTHLPSRIYRRLWPLTLSENNLVSHKTSVCRHHDAPFEGCRSNVFGASDGRSCVCLEATKPIIVITFISKPIPRLHRYYSSRVTIAQCVLYIMIITWKQWSLSGYRRKQLNRAEREASTLHSYHRFEGSTKGCRLWVERRTPGDLTCVSWQRIGSVTNQSWWLYEILSEACLGFVWTSFRGCIISISVVGR